MVCLVVTLLLFISWYFLLSSTSQEPLRKALVSFVLTSSQVVLTELVLGIFQELHLPALVTVNLVIAAILLISADKKRCPFQTVIKADIMSVRQSFLDSLDKYTTVLTVIVLLTYTWIFIASWYLPPRGIDDLTYHLPVLFEYIQTHEIKLLPVALRHHFAFPENAELLFMWPTIFAKNQHMVDCLNLPFAFMSLLAAYALLRFFDISRKNSLFAALLYLLCPMVIMQAGVDYIDIIVSLFLLLSLYFSLLFHKTRRSLYLTAAGMSVGLMLGMKYTAVLLVLPLQALIIPGLFKVRRRYAAGYLLLLFTLCGWWYIRNWVVLKDPFYPLNLLGLRSDSATGGGLVRNITANMKHWTSRYLIEDIGVGTYDGGFGLAFWGMGFSSWLYFTAYSILRPARTGLATFVVLAYLPVGFILILAVPEADVPYTARLSMFVAAIAFFAFCETLKILNDRLCNAILKMAAVGLSVFGLNLMLVSNQPSYSLRRVIADRSERRSVSEFRYMMDALPTQAELRYVWEPLDFLTKREENGLNCAIISESPLFAPAPVYGSNLQNRVIYSPTEAQIPIDAYVYTYYVRNENGQRAAPPNIKVDDSTYGHDLLANDDYAVVSHSDRGCLIIRKSVFSEPGKQALLRTYYRNTWPEAVALAKAVAPLLSEDIPIVTSSKTGYGLRALDKPAVRWDRIVMTPEHMEEKVASSKKINRCYTLGRPLSGYRYIDVSSQGNSALPVYLNERL